MFEARPEPGETTASTAFPTHHHHNNSTVRHEIAAVMSSRHPSRTHAQRTAAPGGGGGAGAGGVALGPTRIYRWVYHRLVVLQTAAAAAWYTCHQAMEIATAFPWQVSRLGFTASLFRSSARACGARWQIVRVGRPPVFAAKIRPDGRILQRAESEQWAEG